MRNILISLFVLIISINSNGQITELNFGINNKFRFDKMEALIPNPYFNNHYEPFDDIWVTSLGFTYRERYTVIFEYSNEEYLAMARVKQPESKINLWGNIVDYCKTINLSLGYKIFPEKSKLNIVPQMGFAYSFSSYYNTVGSSSTDTIKTNYSQLGIIFKKFTFDEYQGDIGLSKGYFFLKPRVEFTYTPFYYFTIFLNGGYNFGFKPIGYVRGWYQINEEPKVDIRSSYSGNYFYLGLGARLNFKFDKLKMQKSAKKD